MWFYNPDGTLAKTPELGKEYYIVGMQGTKYYALHNEVLRPGTGNQRLLSTQVTIEEGKITAFPEGDKHLW